MHKMIEELEDCPIIAAVKDDEGLEACLESESSMVFVLYGDICTIGEVVKKIQSRGKRAVIHTGSNSGVERKRGGGEFFERVYSGGWDYYHQTRADPQGKRVGIVYRASFFCD